MSENKNPRFYEELRSYTPKQLKEHHDQALSYYIDNKGEVSVRSLSRVGKVPTATIRQWLSTEDWDQYLEKDPEDQVELHDRTKDFIKSAGEKYKLTEQEELFCYYYFKTKNADLSARKAGYSAASSYSIASKLLHEPRILRFMKALKENVCTECFIDGVEVIQMWSKIAFADMTDYVNITPTGVSLKPSAVVDGQIITEIKEGRDGITIKLADKMKALDKLSAYLKVLPNDKLMDVKLQVMQKVANHDDADENIKIEIVGI